MMALRIVLTLALLGAFTDALYHKGGPVKLLSRKNFDAEVVQTDMVSIVEFYAPWCGHCKALAPAYAKAASNLEGLVTFGAVDCDLESNKQLCGEYRVQGFPTIKVFPSKAVTKPGSKRRTKAPTDYGGPRTAKGLVDAATYALPQRFITKVRSPGDLAEFMQKSALPKVLLFSTKSASTPLYKGLSTRFSQHLQFGEARNTDAALAEALNVTSFPQLLVLPASAEAEAIPYTGKLKASELIDFLQKQAGIEPSEEKPGKSKAGKDSAKKAAKEEVPEVEVVPLVQLDAVEGLAAQEDAHLLAFFAGSVVTCAKELQALNKEVAALAGLIEAAAVNASESAALSSMGLPVDMQALRSKPCSLQVFLLPFGDSSDADEWSKYTGSMNAKELQSFALTAFPASVPRVDEASLQPFLGLEPKVPKVLLFTDKEATPRLFAALAANMRNRSMLFADVHTSQTAVMEKFGVKKVPAMRVAFLPGPTGAAAEAQDPLDPENDRRLAIQAFPGPYTYAGMAAFLTAMSDALGLAEGAIEDQAVTVSQVNDQEALQQACPSRGGICVLGVLDVNSSGFEGQKSVLEVAAGRHADHPLRFAWIDSNQQPSFLAGFGLSPTDAPTVLAYSASKQRQARLRGTYALETIDKMLNGLLAGREATSPLQEVPRLVDGGQAGDSTGASDAAVEDEFDLSDILGEDVGAGSASKEDLLKQIDAQLLEEEQRQREESSAQPSTKKKGKRRKKSGSKGYSSSKDEL
ncbi:hypothetical protein WJX73_006186 [Symbiochloris irregularis]|uniref:Thioredoxin domain-containing protein n=1 Tax=Symbiochloris irregularis TaxID=706552 RepID=A0AAW1PGC0_9CHLO